MKIAPFLLIGVMIVFVTPTFAISPEEIIEHTLETYQNKGGFTAKLTQTRIIEVLNRTQTTHGTIIMKAPNLFRISYAAPDSQLIVSNGDSVWLYTPELNQVQISPLMSSDNFLYHYFENSRAERLDDDVVSATQCYQLVLTPHQSDGITKRIKAWIAQDTYLPYQIETLDQNGNITRYTFSNVTTTLPADSSLFQFDPPEGVDIFR
ncbi:MAG: outer membrane lipoprotein carrier protein LolA [Gemmatimonadetes bacterium]|nr:MAG: outer membrane lipoprotein carrier protein LolA [Gemmatimonadota bacterium]